MSETTRNEKCTDCERATSCSSAGFDLTCATGKWARKGARFVIVDTSAAGEALTFWRPNGCGYTTQLREAGLYTAEEVEQYQHVRGTDLGYSLEAVALHATGPVPVEALAKIHNVETTPAPQRTEETMPEEIRAAMERFGRQAYAYGCRAGEGASAPTLSGLFEETGKAADALETAIRRALRSPADRIAELEARVGTLSVALEMARSTAPIESGPRRNPFSDLADRLSNPAKYARAAPAESAAPETERKETDDA